MNTNTMDARIKELMAMGATFAEAHKAALDEALAFGKGKKPTGKPAPAPVEKVKYTKSNGEEIMCTPKQAARFEELKANAPERKARFDAMCAERERKHAEYKPSKDLIEAIKTNRASITHEIAKTKYGFVGTRKELKALKDQVCAK